MSVTTPFLKNQTKFFGPSWNCHFLERRELFSDFATVSVFYDNSIWDELALNAFVRLPYSGSTTGASTADLPSFTTSTAFRLTAEFVAVMLCPIDFVVIIVLSGRKRFVALNTFARRVHLSILWHVTVSKFRQAKSIQLHIAWLRYSARVS